MVKMSQVKFCEFPSFYNLQVESCRKSVIAWQIIAKRLNIYKDLRIYISKIILESEKEGLFPIFST